MSTMFTVTDHCENELLEAIEKYLIEINVGDECRIYFSGTDDSHQTQFEHDGCYLKIGVLARNETVALVLLRFLRIIIDNKINFLEEDALFKIIHTKKKSYMEKIALNGEKVKMSKIIKKIAEKEEPNSCDFSLNDELFTRFYKENFTVKLDEIDIWTLPRIMKEMEKLY